MRVRSPELGRAERHSLSSRQDQFPGSGAQPLPPVGRVAVCEYVSMVTGAAFFAAEAGMLRDIWLLGDVVGLMAQLAPSD